MDVFSHRSDDDASAHHDDHTGPLVVVVVVTNNRTVHCSAHVQMKWNVTNPRQATMRLILQLDLGARHEARNDNKAAAAASMHMSRVANILRFWPR